MGSSKGFKSHEDFEEGKRLVIGSNEIEIVNEVSVEQFESGLFFIDSD